MAMDPDRLGDALTVTWLSFSTAPSTPGDEAALKTFMRAFAADIIEEIVGNATTVTSTPNATAGAATLPGTGTVTA